jgi:hypothetical protein
MPAARLRLLPNVDPQQVLSILREWISSAPNVVQGGVHQQVRDLRDAYLWWEEPKEEQLWAWTHDLDTATMFHTPGHWHVRQIASGQPNAQLAPDARAVPLIRGELERHAGRLRLLADDLERRIARASAGSGHPTILDTNLLLHCMRPDQVKWTEVVGRAPVRLVVPLRVVEELDAKKYAGNAKLGGRARAVLPWLETAVGPSGEAKDVADGVTIEVTVEPGPREHPSDADREILDVCHEIRQFGGAAPTLVTGDTGALLRAHAEEILAIKMPVKYGKDQPEPES